MLIYAKIVIQLELLLEHIVELTHGKLTCSNPTKLFPNQNRPDPTRMFI